MATTTVTKAFNTPLVFPQHDEEEGVKDVSYVPIPDGEEPQFQIGGPILCGIWNFLMHVVMGVFASSFSYIPYVGDSPVWLRAVILVATFLIAAVDHLTMCFTSNHGKLDHIWKALLLPGLLGPIFFLSKLSTVVPAWESASLVFVFMVLLAGPGAAYKKTTGKEAPATHSEIMESMSTWAGVVLHTGVDTAFAIYFLVCWNLMGSPLLMAWFQ